jgi:hypothetical protein
MIKSVKALRDERFASVEKKSGVYTWWFKKSCLSNLLKALPTFNISKLQHKKIDNTDYYALYFGIAKSCRERASWHMSQHHSVSSVRSGYLSTLRQTLSALLGKNMTEAEETVNGFIEDNCFWEWQYTTSREEAHDIEAVELGKNLYPLNIQGNKMVPREVSHALSALRKEYKK